MTMPPSDRLIDWWPEFEQVKKLWRQGHVATAASLLGEAEARYPGSPVLRLVRGLQLLQEDVHRGSSRRVQEISDVVSGAASQMPDNVHAQLVAAEIMVDLGEFPAAAGYVRAVRPRHEELVEPEAQAALAYVMGRLCEEGGKRDLALSLFREAVAQDPEDERYRASAQRMAS